MAELPEVHTITQDLKKHITGYTIKKVRVLPGYRVFPEKDAFLYAVEGAKILDVSRVAKNIIIHLDSGKYLRIHLAMTGQLLLKDFEDKGDKWVKLVLLLEKNDEKKVLKFADMRMFGKVFLVEKTDLDELSDKYKPEYLDEDLNVNDFLEILKSKKTNIKNALLDQQLVSGLGNIYATDALFISRLHPETITSELNLSHAEKLLEAARQILREGIKNRGSTLPDKMYVDIFGNEGKHQKYFRIYMRDKCPECKSEVKFIKLNGRGTYFCEICQVRPGPKSLL